MDGLVGLLIVALVLVLVFGAIYYIIGLIPMDARFKQIAYIILAVIFVLILLFRVLLPLLGESMAV